MPENKNNHHFQGCEIGRWNSLHICCSRCIENIDIFAQRFVGRNSDGLVNRETRSLPKHLGGGIVMMVERDDIQGVVECIDLKNEFGRMFLAMDIWDMLDDPRVGESDWIKPEVGADA